MTEKQKAEAETIYLLASQLDAARHSGKPESAVAAVARELRAISGTFREVQKMPVPATAEPAADPIDQLAQKRAKRIGTQGG